jgi:hypothetical protein
VRYNADALVRVDQKPIAPSLVVAGHLGGRMPELLLYIALKDLGRGGESGT